MLIVTAGSGDYNYWKTIKYNEDKCKEFGYSIKTYDLGGLGFGTSVEDPRCKSKFRRVKSAMKPELLLDAVCGTTEDDVVWIDGDATLIRPIDEIAEDDSFDIGLTVRPKRVNKKTHYINAGVIFVKNRIESKLFLQDWIHAMPPIPNLNTDVKPSNYSDQQVLEETLLLPNIDVVPWDAFMTVHDVHGARVKFFECAEYNDFGSCEYMRPPAVDTKIIHFKGYLMDRITEYVERFL